MRISDWSSDVCSSDLLVVVYILNFIDRQIISIIAVDIMADLGLSDGDMGFLGGAAFAGFYELFGIPPGRPADNWYRVKLLSDRTRVVSGKSGSVSVGLGGRPVLHKHKHITNPDEDIQQAE